MPSRYLAGLYVDCPQTPFLFIMYLYEFKYTKSNCKSVYVNDMYLDVNMLLYADDPDVGGG